MAVPIQGYVKNGKAYIGCPICDERLDVRQSKTDKPYVVCTECGVQLFIRGDVGIERLHEILKKGVGTGA